MAGSRDVRAGGAFVEIFGKDAALNKVLDRAAQRVSRFGGVLKNVGTDLAKAGAAMVAPLLLAGKQYADMGDQIAKASARTGVGVESLSELKYAAEQSGMSFEDLEGALRKMNKAVSEQAQGGGNNGLLQLGITADKLKGQKPEQQLALIGDALSKLKNPGDRAAAAMEIFGRGGTALLPLFSEGAAGMRELTERARLLGLTMSTGDAKAAEEFHDRMDDALAVGRQFGFVIGSAVAPVLREAAVWLTRVAVAATDWVREHKAMVITALKVGAAVLAGGTALAALGAALAYVGGMVSGVIGFLGTLLPLVGSLALPVLFLVGAWKLLSMAMDDVGQVGQAVGEYLAAVWADLKETATTALGGIKDALAAGDWKLAAQILWAGLKLAWLQGTQDLQKGWIEWKAAFVEVAVKAFYAVREGWDTLVYGFRIAWAETIAFLQSAWAGFKHWYAEIINSMAEKFDWFTERRIRKEEEAGKISHQEAEAQRADLRKQQGIARDETQQNYQADTAAIEAAKKETERKAKEEMKSQLAKDRQAKAELLEGVNPAAQAQIKALDDEIERLKNDLTSARQQAAEESKSSPTFKLGAFKSPLSPKGMEELAAKTTGTVGTFNAAIAGQLGGGTLERIDRGIQDLKKPIQDTAKGIQVLVDYGGSAFA